MSVTDTPLGSQAVAEIVRRRIVVEGHVQGVWFRASAEREAARLHIAGSAANRYDGSVELVAEGDAAAVERFEAWARVGPPRAVVTNVRVTDEKPRGTRGFNAR
jgi:acylphosphatase